MKPGTKVMIESPGSWCHNCRGEIVRRITDRDGNYYKVRIGEDEVDLYLHELKEIKDE